MVKEVETFHTQKRLDNRFNACKWLARRDVKANKKSIYYLMKNMMYKQSWHQCDFTVLSDKKKAFSFYILNNFKDFCMKHMFDKKRDLYV